MFIQRQRACGEHMTEYEGGCAAEILYFTCFNHFAHPCSAALRHALSSSPGGWPSETTLITENVFKLANRVAIIEIL